MTVDRMCASRVMFLAIGSWLVGCVTASAAVLCVAPGGPVAASPRFRPAIAAAHTGNTIIIQPGEYVENVTVDKSLTIGGVDRDEVLSKILLDGATQMSIQPAPSGATIS